MAVVVRLSRQGKNKRPFYHIVAADSRRPRDGRKIEQIGVYDPLGETQLALDEDRAKHWLQCGARLSPMVRRLFKRVGIPLRAEQKVDSKSA